jgi:hypothetical protein
VVGVSRGAVAAVDLARNRRARFGFCALLLPATEPVQVVEALSATSLPRGLRVFGVLAHYDRWRDDGARLLAALGARGAMVQTLEVPEGHGRETWRRHVALALECFALRTLDPGPNGRPMP